MSYSNFKANVASEFDNNFSQGKVEQLQSVTYATNVTAVESQSKSITVATNVTAVNSQSLVTRTNVIAVESQSLVTRTNVTAVELQSLVTPTNDFTWSALDNPSDMNYEIIYEYCCCVCLFVPILWPFMLGMLLNTQDHLKSQKLKITDTHLDYEHSVWDSSNCCYLGQAVIKRHHISLDHISMIRRNSFEPSTGQCLCITYNEDGYNKLASIWGLTKTSNTPKLIKDIIIQRRPKKTQTTPYSIPHITTACMKESTISLIPENASINYKTSNTDLTAYVDGLGSIVEHGQGSGLDFWSPPIGRSRGGSGDGPEISAYFPDKTSCSIFKYAVEASRDSFK